MPFKKFIRGYFDYSRKDRIGILTLVSLIFATLIAPSFFRNRSIEPSVAVDTAWMAAIERLEQEDSAFKARDPRYKDDNSTSARNTAQQEFSFTKESFPFDPNTIPDDDWKKLGLRDRTIRTIRNYLNKGGHFYQPKDLKKIYGLKETEYQDLYPYIQIKTDFAKDIHPEKKDLFPLKKDFHYQPVDINLADTTALIALPGIGSKLASRIINFREKLGGFYAIEQVKETYGLQDSTFEKIKPYLKLEPGMIKKININKAGINDLKVHPYIRYSIATAIVAYREQHGAFSSLEDLKKVMVVTDDVYEKIIEYLSINNN